jgi:RNA polymerase sigma-70 factor, ECF subfamily
MSIKRDLSQSQDEIELKSLMRSAQQGDSASYKKLLLRINAMLAQYVQSSFSRLGLAESGTRDDVVQEILLAIHAKRHTFDPEQFFLAWMYAIARYKVIDFIRKHRFQSRSTVPIGDELETLEAAGTVGSDLDVTALCESLPAKQREILELVKIQGLSVAEASQRTGYSPSDIKINVHRAIKTMRKRAGL